MQQDGSAFVWSEMPPLSVFYASLFDKRQVLVSACGKLSFTRRAFALAAENALVVAHTYENGSQIFGNAM